jgi:hypothetical protein
MTARTLISTPRPTDGTDADRPRESLLDELLTPF